ncbi:hypothetical protein AAG906_017644 [Vitis piasezkii]
MGFGGRWCSWIKWCLSTVRFSVLVNGSLTSFFESSRGLRQGDPLSPYLFVIVMEAFSCLMKRAVEGGFLMPCMVWGRRGEGVQISHLLFADDTLIFWLKVNLEKSELIPVGRVENIGELADEFGYKVGILPSIYLGMPLGAPFKSIGVWDGIKERFRKKLAMAVRMRLEKMQRNFLWGGGALEQKPHLVRWPIVCEDKSKGGLGVIRRKYGEERGGWRSCEIRETYGVVEGERRGSWTPTFNRPFNDWEMEEVGRLLCCLEGKMVSVDEEDRVRWVELNDGVFPVKSLYRALQPVSSAFFPSKIIWMSCAQPIISFFAWEASWGRVLTLDRLQKRG